MPCILAIHDGHDAGACLVRDGTIVLYSSEERRTGRKNAGGVPRQSVLALLERGGVTPRDIDAIALSGRILNRAPGSDARVPAAGAAFNLLTAAARSEVATRLGRRLLPRVRRRGGLLAFLNEVGLGAVPLTAHDHHLCHAACAYHHRPWDDDTLVLTHDGSGDGLCATVNVGSGFDLRPIAQTPKYHSLSNCLYTAVTQHLGLKPWEHEEKVMSLAPYGRPEPCLSLMRPWYGVEGLHFRNRTGHTITGMRRFLRRRLEGQRFDNLAAACQTLFEELVLEWAQAAVRATGLRRVAVAGDAFLNVAANALVRDSPEVEALYVYPASDDRGVVVGAGILGYLDACRLRNHPPRLDLPEHVYLGLDFSEAEVEAAVKRSGHPYRRLFDPAEDVASLVADGKVVARFDGREEIGPRALGNRSILADPRNPGMIRALNYAVKERDFWMPLAVSILPEDTGRYIRDCSERALWMIETFRTTPDAAEDIIAGLHPRDLTIRPQIVDDLNPAFRDIIRAFKQRTGVGVLLNTSLNLDGFPIVGSPDDALDTFDRSGIDALALGAFMVSRKDATSRPRPAPATVETPVRQPSPA